MLLQTKEEKKCYGMQEKVKNHPNETKKKREPNPKKQTKKKPMKDDCMKLMLCVHHCKRKFMCVGVCVDEGELTRRVTHVCVFVGALRARVCACVCARFACGEC